MAPSPAPMPSRPAAALLSLLLLVRPCSASGRGSSRRARRGSTPLASQPGARCCAAVSGACGASGEQDDVTKEKACCTLIGPSSGCLGLRTRSSCEHAYTTAARDDGGRAYCAWLGGRCVAASAADCEEQASPTAKGASAIDYYGERAGFERHCGNGPSSTCPGLRSALERYAAAHRAATRHASPPGGLRSARLLVIRDHWKNVGMGFMPSHVATLILFALSAGVYVYVENYGRYDWTRYFVGHAGLDLRWTPAKQRVWKQRFAAAGVVRTHVEVWHEDGSRRGDEEWEERLSAHLANASCRWISVNGWATTINWKRVLQPAMPAAVSAFRRRADAARARAVRAAAARAAADGERPSNGTSAGESTRNGETYLHGGVGPVPLRGGPSWLCISCTVWAMFRPRAVLRRALDASPIGSSTPLACIKARTMYAEDKRFFPDTLPPTLTAIDALWDSYSGQLADTTFWGPRDRLRCHNVSAPKPSHALSPKEAARKPLVAPSAALGCMESIRSALGSHSRLFVAVDAPRLQETIFRHVQVRAARACAFMREAAISQALLSSVLAQGRAFITPGVGIDPTNEYRDGDAAKLARPRTQTIGRQELTERNLIKVNHAVCDHPVVPSPPLPPRGFLTFYGRSPSITTSRAFASRHSPSAPPPFTPPPTYVPSPYDPPYGTPPPPTPLRRRRNVRPRASATAAAGVTDAEGRHRRSTRASCNCVG